MHIHHLTLLVIFVPQSWYGRDFKKCKLQDTRLNIHLLVHVFQHQILLFLKTNFLIFMIALTMTTNGQLNNTHGYHIKPTNSTCNLISCFRLKAPCSSARSNFIYCRKVLSMKNSLINIKTKKCTPKSVLRLEFASVYNMYHYISLEFQEVLFGVLILLNTNCQ